MPQSSNDGLPPELLQQIATRLRAVCAGVPDDEFARLVEDVARVKLKYEEDRFADRRDPDVGPAIARKTG
jgi:hypothetical protein